MLAASFGDANHGSTPSRHLRGLLLGFFLALNPGLGASQSTPPLSQSPVPVPGDSAAGPNKQMQDKLGRWNPSSDDWASEEFNQAVQQQLALLTKPWSPRHAVQVEDLAPLLTQEFSSNDLRPPTLEVVFDDGVFQVRRHSTTPTSRAKLPATIHGPQNFANAITQLLHPFQDTAEFHVKLKNFAIEDTGDSLITQAYYFAEGRGEESHIQQKAIWTCVWLVPANQVPILSSVKVAEFEEVRGPNTNRKLFADCTESMFINSDIFQKQLLPSMEYWRRRIPHGLDFSDQSHQGIAIGDVNRDGLEDVYLPQPGGLPNRLFLHQADGTFLDSSAASGVDFLDTTRCALLLDLDNDGDLDLVTNLGADLVFLANDGQGHFTIKTSGHAPETTMLAAADFDQDGFLDIYVCRYLNPYENQAVPIPYHDANNGLDNVLLRFTADWKIQDITDDVGLSVNNQRFSFAASWEDYDNDGDQDLYVANDFGRNNLYRNDHGYFVDVAAEAGVEDISAGMGVSWGDYDRDGHVDLYVSNMYSSAGNRVAYQRSFRPESNDRFRREIRRHARGNSLFRNLGNGRFRDVSLTQNVNRGRWAWGSIFVDINNDAWLDLIVPNGFITNERNDDL